MDYRNADGSRAQMCGNGSRVFAAYLRREGLETGGHFSIATRAGVKQVHFEGENISIDLGPWELADPVTAAAKGYDATVVVPGGPELSGLSVDMGNPHTVAAVSYTHLDVYKRQIRGRRRRCLPQPRQLTTCQRSGANHPGSNGWN